VGKPNHAGSSVKLNLTKRELTKAFRPRPFLIVSNSRVLKQGFAWVCLCSSVPYSSRPDWIVPLPEFGTFCLTAKLHVVSVQHLDDVKRRELLTLRGTIRPKSISRVREAILRLVDGDFAPESDPAPIGSVVRGTKGERLVISRCDLSSLYKGAKALATMVALESGGLSAGKQSVPPTIVPVSSASDQPEHDKGREPGFLDLVHVFSQHWFKSPPLFPPVGASTMADVRDAIANILEDDPGAGTEVLTEEEAAAAEDEEKQLLLWPTIEKSLSQGVIFLLKPFHGVGEGNPHQLNILSPFSQDFSS